MDDDKLNNLCPVRINDEYEKNPLLKSEDVQYITKWFQTLEERPHSACIIDGISALFLASNNYDIETTKKCVLNNVNVRGENPEIFKNRDPLNPKIKAVWDIADAWISPKRTPENYSVFYSGFINSDPKSYDFCETMKANILIGEAHVLSIGTTLPGMIIVIDAKGTSYHHLLKSSMRIVKQFVTYVQLGMPCRVAGVHVININSLVGKILYVLRPFIKSTLLDNIHLHSTDLTEFYKLVPRDVLPKELGGTLDYTRKELQQQAIAKIESMRDWFLEEENMIKLSYEKGRKINKNDKDLDDSTLSIQSLNID